MFNNLIESSLHTREFKRRGSFVLFTTAVYALLFASAGVASIYAYDAHLNSETNELVLLGFVPIDQPKAVNVTPRKSSNTSTTTRNSAPAAAQQHLDTHVVDRVNPNNVLDGTSNIRSPLPPTHSSGGDGPPGPQIGPSGGGGDISGTPNGTPSQIVHVVETPPAPTPRPVPRTISKPVLNGYALELPKPIYSEIAKRIRAQGPVQVQVLIDETGKVVSAHAVSGNTFLASEAVKAAYRARFSPTKLGDEPVKVSGVITYNFMLN